MMNRTVDLPPEDSLGFQVRRCHRAFDRTLNAHLSRRGLKSGFWYFLRALWQENGVTQKRLAELNNVTEPTTVTTLSAMDRLGLVRRERNPHDRRKLCVVLTSSGEALKSELMPLALRVNAIAAEGIAHDELATCLSVLKRMSANLSREVRSAAAKSSGQ